MHLFSEKALVHGSYLHYCHILYVIFMSRKNIYSALKFVSKCPSLITDRRLKFSNCVINNIEISLQLSLKYFVNSRALNLYIFFANLSTCGLSANPAVCEYKIRLNENESWIFISKLSRNRVSYSLYK